MNGTSSTPSSTSSSFYTEFSPVHRKKRKSRAPKEREPLLAIVQRLREELGHDDWLSECQQILVESLAKASLATISEVICLGLGSPAASATARVQLAFLLAICENLNIDRAKVFLYDPVFTAEDMTLFAELQVQLLTENKDAAYVIDHPTLCFMPHCDLALYENIIRANWSKTRLPNLVLVANRLADYVESNPRHQLETKAPFLLNLDSDSPHSTVSSLSCVAPLADRVQQHGIAVYWIRDRLLSISRLMNRISDMVSVAEVIDDDFQ